MSFLDWLGKYAAWSKYGWLVLIGVGVALEILGRVKRDGTTFSDLIRATVPIGWRLAVFLVLIWHLCFAKANYPHKWWWF